MDYNFASKIQCMGIAIGLVFHNGYGADNTPGFLQQDIGIDRISTDIVQKKEPVLLKQAPFGIGCK